MPDMATPGTKPTSALLQDLLREKKAQSQRAKKTHDPAHGQKNGLDDREIQSSPIAATSPRDRLDAHSRRDSGLGIRKEMGLKEMQEHISKMSKQNFNLKLEVHYCRERNKTLETKLERFQELEADNRELQSINEELMSELETRIVAVEQAVDVICEREATIEELEAKNKELEMAVVRMDFSRSPSSSDAEPAKEGTEVIASNLSPTSGTELSGSSDNAHIGDQSDQQPLSEHSLSAPDTLSPPKAPSARRIPSFMRDNKKSTTVLRSLYSSNGNASFVSLGRPVSIFSGDDDDDRIDRQMSNSPQLSILSESGFESIYGGRKDQTSGETDGEDNVADPHLPKLPSNPPQRNAQSQLRLRRWLDEKNMTRTPSPKGREDDKVSSIGEVLSQAPTSFQDRNAIAAKVPDYPHEQRTPEKRQGKQPRNHEKRSSSPCFAGPIFGAAVLPPTPDTMSTATLNVNSSTASIITEKSVLDHPAQAHSALLLDTRPHSSESGNGSGSLGSLRDIVRPGMSVQSHTRGISESNAARRPSLTISGADTFSGRTLSFPSPTGRARRLSGQRPPQSYRGSDSNSDKTVDPSPQERLRSGSAATITPTRRTAIDDHRSPLPPQEATGPSPITALPHLSASPPRSSSLRSKIVSRFSRSSANNATRIPNPSSNLNDTTPSRPPVTRAPASIQHARLHRPASLYGQHSPSPSPSPTYALKSMIPDEEDMLTSLERYSAGSARNIERGRERKRMG